MAGGTRQRSAAARANTTLGADLQRCRKARGWSIEAASHATKIKPDQIAAIERNDFENFPSTAYLRGFLRIYARAVGLDERLVLAKFDGKPTTPEQGMVSATAIDALPPVTRHDHSAPPRVPAWAWMAGAGAALLVLGIGFTIYRVGFRNISESARNAALADAAPKAEPVSPGLGGAAVPRAEVVTPVAKAVPVAKSGAAAPAETPPAAPGAESAAGSRLVSSIPKAALVRLPEPREALASATPVNAGSIAVTPIDTVMKSPGDTTGAPRAILVHPAQVRPGDDAAPDAAPVIKSREPVVASSAGPSPATAGSTIPTGGGVPRAQLAVAESVLQLDASSEVWLRVVVNGNEDEEAFNGVLIPGQQLKFKGQRFYVKTNQPNALSASLNGQPRKPLGTSPVTAEFNFGR